MPNPVVSFEIRGPDAVALRKFYSDVFGWETFMFPSGYAAVETTEHTHDDASGKVTYEGADAFMNEGVVIGASDGQPAWKYQGEPGWHAFQHGTEGGGIAEGAPGLTFYIQVSDLVAALAAVVKHGGQIHREPEQVAPNVMIAVFLDPAGNEIGLTRAPQ